MRVHGTTRDRSQDLLVKERAHLLPLPDRSRLAPFLWEEPYGRSLMGGAEGGP